MPPIKTSGGKVVTKAGVPSCSCCACACLSDSDFDYGDDGSYTLSRFWRTESTESGDLFDIFVDETLDGWDWSDAYVSGPGSGETSFTVCDVQEIDFNITTDSLATSAEVRFYLNGVLVHTEGSLAGSEDIDYTLDIFGDPEYLDCENVVKVEVDYGSGTQAGVVGIDDVR